MFSIKQTALSVGFDACGIAKAELLADDGAFMEEWLKNGNHAEMTYLERNFQKRIDPRELVPGCKSVVVVLMNYFPHQKQSRFAPQIAKYAYSALDYHLVLKSKLALLEQKIIEFYGTDAVSKTNQHLFVDSAPVLERRWAQRAGLGWIGKHMQLIHPGLGSYVFIGTLFLSIETEYDSPVTSKCGGCTKCLDACPTKALSKNSLDARRCISYLTIETKNEIPHEFHDKLSNFALGCDICADVCPWNAKWSKPTSQMELAPESEILNWGNERWNQLQEHEFNQYFKKSAIQRAGFRKLKQNLEILVNQNK